MANQVFETKEITLLDGETLNLRPLAIKGKRKFFAEFKKYQTIVADYMEKIEDARVAAQAGERASEEISETNFDIDVLDVMVELVAICLERDYPDYAKKTPKGGYAKIEDNVDEDSMYEIIRVCAGVNLNAKQDATAAMEAILNQVNQEDGTT